ncbi:hypothetical protein DK926_26050 [Rhodococcus sp. Eu-32]|uniref:hypothetical protein n=1 Tax=Rhodococcus sp. Eu-32 TaxID=1017319 RepID=UPI000F7A7AC1|nr:hypothetical protein [Rhodococcus sp. Eu-32]RRQ24908.1 hypothetical protein DK926_26050 [Rhodococcus sp. Eu-32]
MALHDRRERWLANAHSVHSTTEQLLSGGGLPADRNADVLIASMVGTLQGIFTDQFAALDGDAPEGELATAISPFAAELRKFDALDEHSLPTTNGELRDILGALRDAAATVAATLESDSSLRVQSVDEVIAEFAEGYRVTLLLTLTACHALSTKVTGWQASKDENRSPGDHLDVSTMRLSKTKNTGTVPMSTLSSLMTAPPTIMTPGNEAAMFAEMFNGGTPPPLYRMAYGQWFGSVAAMWEDVYRERLAIAHGTDEEGRPWKKNDVKSEFFYELSQIRHDFAHKDGLCVESASNAILSWGVEGQPLSPTPRQMLSLIDAFPASELRKTPERVPRTTERLPFNFPSDWVAKVKAHVVAIERTKKLRPDVLRKVIDKWMEDSQIVDD